MLLMLGLFAGCASAQLRWDNKTMMDVFEVKPGMTGYGKTVFHGTKLETFNFTVIGIQMLDLSTYVVMVKITSGPVVDKQWGIVAGMSGSPMYINGRLIGALAYGWSYEKEPIAGVTPIREMMESYQPGSSFTTKTASLPKPKTPLMQVAGKTFSCVRIAANAREATAMQRTAAPGTMVLAPVATPLYASGMSEQQVALLQKTLEPYNFAVMPSVTKAGLISEKEIGGPVKMEPGAAIATGMVDGDIQLIGTGTVTYVKDKTVIAFGHPLAGFGDVDFPMYTSYVWGVLPTLSSSFKLCTPISCVGTVTRDHFNSIGGTLGRKPNQIQVNVFLHNVLTGYRRKFHCGVSVVRPYTAQWMLSTAFLRTVCDIGVGPLTHVEKDWGVYDIRTKFTTDKYGVLEQHMVASAKVGGTNFPLIEAYGLVDALVHSPYENVKLTNINLAVEYTPNADATARIEQVTPDRLVARPGDTVMLTVKLRRYGQPMEIRQIPVRVPENTSASTMAVAVIGGAETNLSRQVMTTMPARAEGTKGLVRLLTGELSGRRLVVASFFPTPSYVMGGSQLTNMPGALSDLLPLSDFWSSAAFGAKIDMGYSNSLVSNQSLPYPGLRPTVITATKEDPLLISGAQMINIAIDNGTDQPGSGSISYSMPGSPSPVQALLTSTGQPKSTSLLDVCTDLLDYTPAERRQSAQFFSDLAILPPPPAPIALPVLSTPAVTEPLPLSSAALPAGVAVALETKTPAEPTALPASSTPAKPESSPIVSAKQAMLSLAEAKDFARGKHFGTAISAQGKLMMVPTVHSIYRISDLVPWKAAVHGNTVYLSGWGSNQVQQLDGDGKATVCFPQGDEGKDVQGISALAVDGQGRLLIASWPDQCVRLLRADGSVLQRWTLPCANIWDLAVTANGKRYAACSNGTLYRLNDDELDAQRAVCTVPDLHVFALATDSAGNLYLGSSPRGKIYRLSPDDHLTAIYEASGTSMASVTSLAVDRAGFVYAGLSPSCTVVRIAPNGAVQTLMTGAGKDNHHVYALKMVGDELYAATGLAGGIYRISNPAGANPDVTTIYAREDIRTIDAGDRGTGPESLAVTALAVGEGKALYAAAAFPAQVLKIEPRSEATFLSPVLKAPAVAKWGALDLVTKGGDLRDLVVESRTGLTSSVDKTWSDWAVVNPTDEKVASAPATCIQFRFHLTNHDGKAPAVENVRLTYQAANLAPTVKFTEPKTTAAWSGTKELKWDSADPDNDPLVDTVFTSADNGNTWQPLLPSEPEKPAAKPDTKTETKPEEKTTDKPDAKPEVKQDTKPDAKDVKTSDKPETKPDVPAKEPEKAKPSPEITKKSLNWDTKAMPDGVYLVKVVTSDKYARPTDPKSAEVVTTITIDNTPPTVAVDDKVTGMEAVKRLELRDDLSPIVSGSYRLDDGPWIALVPESGIFSSKHEWVTLVSPDGTFTLAAGEHKLTIQAKDAAENLLEKKVTVMIP